MAEALKRMRMTQQEAAAATDAADDMVECPETPYSERRDSCPIVKQSAAHSYVDPVQPSLRLSTCVHHMNEPSGVSEQSDVVPAKKKKRLSLPWWCSIVAWLFLWTTVGVSVAFVTFFGIMFQDEKCKKWISSMVISFLTSVLFTQPIKVLLLALFFALVLKKTDDDQEEQELEDEEDFKLDDDETWLHSSTINSNHTLLTRLFTELSLATSAAHFIHIVFFCFYARVSIAYLLPLARNNLYFLQIKAICRIYE